MFRVQGSGFRCQDLGFRIWGLAGSSEFKDCSVVGGLSPPLIEVQGSGFRVQGSGFRVQGSGFRVQGYRVLGFGFRVFGFGFWV